MAACLCPLSLRKVTQSSSSPRSRIVGSGKGLQVEMKLPFVPKPSDTNQHESAEESDQSDGADQVESLKEEFSTMSLKTKKGKEKGRDSDQFETLYEQSGIPSEIHAQHLKVKRVIQRHHFNGFVICIMSL